MITKYIEVRIFLDWSINNLLSIIEKTKTKNFFNKRLKNLLTNKKIYVTLYLQSFKTFIYFINRSLIIQFIILIDLVLFKKLFKTKDKKIKKSFDNKKIICYTLFILFLNTQIWKQ